MGMSITTPDTPFHRLPGRSVFPVCNSLGECSAYILCVISELGMRLSFLHSEGKMEERTYEEAEDTPRIQR